MKPTPSNTLISVVQKVIVITMLPLAFGLMKSSYAEFSALPLLLAVTCMQGLVRSGHL